jgi:DNA repair protein RadC
MIESLKKTKCTSPEIAAEIIKGIIKSYEEHEQGKEHFYVLGLNNKNVIQYVDLVSIGTVSEAMVHPREVFRYAISKNVSSILIAHNHPSGDCTPSKEDIKTTERLVEAGKILGIPLMDHVIVGESYLSLREEGLIAE